MAPIGPSLAELQLLKAWAIRQNLSADRLYQVVNQALAGSGCLNSADLTAYGQYLAGLLEGRHEKGRLADLTVQALQHAGTVLMAWREWLQCYPEVPSSLETVLLDCLAEAQALLLKRLAERQPDHDRITGLPDRAALPAAVNKARAATRPSRQFAVMSVEITAGQHVYPDALLQLLAQRLAGMLRSPEQDTLLLIDRQTFGLVLADLNGEGHALLAAHRALSFFEEAVLMQDGRALKLHPRIGIALAPQHGEAAKQLLEAATVALHTYSADRVSIYDPQQDKLHTALFRLEAPLRDALEYNLLHLAFQPQIDCRDGSFHGMESLLRWQDEKLGMVRPDEIVMVAEHLGLMPMLTQWILNASLREFAKLIALGVPGSISINITASNLLDRELRAAIQDALTLWQVPPQRVVLEITESGLIGNLDDALLAMHALKRLGCKLALDDFGTGYSSLSYLKRLPIDELKIDRSFILTMRESAKDAGIVRTIIELAHLLELVVVTEGVEDAETVRMLTGMGNDVIQGYVHSQPLPPQAIPDYLASLNLPGKRI